eukprot:4008656-Heterocapsa_arctica.AAC.1
MGEAAPAARPVMFAGHLFGDCATHVGPSDRHTMQPVTGIGCLTFMVKTLPGHVTGPGEPIGSLIRLTAVVMVALSGLTLATAATRVGRPRAIVPL